MPAIVKARAEESPVGARIAEIGLQRGAHAAVAAPAVARSSVAAPDPVGARVDAAAHDRTVHAIHVEIARAAGRGLRGRALAGVASTGAGASRGSAIFARAT